MDALVEGSDTDAQTEEFILDFDKKAIKQEKDLRGIKIGKE